MQSLYESSIKTSETSICVGKFYEHNLIEQTKYLCLKLNYCISMERLVWVEKVVRVGIVE